jgi:CDP-4-dehydro-6-deoxyglucose reductase
MPPPPTFDARLLAARVLSPSVRELTFERTDGAPFPFEPGQWVSFILAVGGTELRRSYSIASPPNGSARFDITVTHVQGGPGSSLLHSMQPGEVVTVVGPQGFFTRPLDQVPPSLFIATGTGVTPFRSMLGAAVAAGDTTPTWLLFGVRREADILYREELAELTATHPHIRVVPTLSQPSSPEWSGRRGYVQAHVRELFEGLAVLPASAGRLPHAYVCGLERMVGSVRQLLRKEMGLPRERVHTERYD